MKSKSVYFDHNSTTKVDKKVYTEMYPYFRQKYGNASCAHNMGMISEVALQKARLQIANLLNSENPERIYFTSGATESNNLVLKGILIPKLTTGRFIHVITSIIEHPSILNCLRELKKYFSNLDITYINVDTNGILDLNQFKTSISMDTSLVTIMTVNNETGSIQPIYEISSICKESSIPFHTDATQYFGKDNAKFISDGTIDLISLSSHKIYGPKGIGALYLNTPLDFFKLISGGGQENNIRSGTENIPGIVGFGKAAELIKSFDNEYYNALKYKRDFLKNKIRNICQQNKIEIIFNTYEQSIVNTLNFSIPKSLNKNITSVEFFNKHKIFLTAGSACSSGKPVPSYVLKAMGRNDQEASSSIRISLGKYNTFDHVNYFIDIFRKYINYLNL